MKKPSKVITGSIAIAVIAVLGILFTISSNSFGYRSGDLIDGRYVKDSVDVSMQNSDSITTNPSQVNTDISGTHTLSHTFTVEKDLTKDKIKVTFADGHITTVDNPDGEWLRNINQVDINFDGIFDIEKVVQTGAYNVGTEYLVQDKSTRTFLLYQIPKDRPIAKEGDLSPGLALTRFDPESKTLVSFFKGRGVGDIYTMQYFVFENNEWILSSEEIQDEYRPSNRGVMSDGPTEYYIKTLINYRKKPVETKIEYLKMVQNPDGSVDFIGTPKPF